MEISTRHSKTTYNTISKTEGSCTSFPATVLIWSLKVTLEPWRLRQCLKIWGLVLWLLDDLAGADSLGAAQINILSNFLYIFFHLLLAAAFRVTVSSNTPVIINRDKGIHSVQVTSSSQAHTHKDTHTIHPHLWQFRVSEWPNVHIFELCGKTHKGPGRRCTIQKDPIQSLSINYFVPGVEVNFCSLDQLYYKYASEHLSMCLLPLLIQAQVAPSAGFSREAQLILSLGTTTSSTSRT